MATELTNLAEDAIYGFYRAGDALASLGKLYDTTYAGVDTIQSSSRAVDVTQHILDMAVQKVVERLSWRMLQEPDATPASVGLPELLDLCIDGIAHKYLIVSAAYKVLEDVMEAQTIRTCEAMWDLVEARKEKLSTRDIHSETGRPTKAALCLLRMCNALLRRVSKTHNSVFCGRILVFLSFTFALSERSAVNLTGKPNVSNSTTFEDEGSFEAADAAEAAAAATVTPVQLDKDSAKDGVPIDYNLYRTFWHLQRFCREHNLAIKSVDDWEKFHEELNTVLSAFEGNAFSPDDLERTRDLLSGSAGVAVGGDTDEESSTLANAQEHFFQPKYLTSSRLFRLQLRDPILRECMLTQFLILLHHLSKAKQPDGCKTPKSRLQVLSDRVVKLIRETPPSGKRFNEMLDLVLERERNWIKWKQEKCPSYERYPPAPDALPKKRRMDDAPPLPSRPLTKRARPHDNSDSALMEQILTESSKPSAILERIRGQDRATAVPMATFTDRFAEAWNPENGIEEAYWPDKDKMFCWRTLRMAMKTNVVHMHLAVDGTDAVVKAIVQEST